MIYATNILNKYYISKYFKSFFLTKKRMPFLDTLMIFFLRLLIIT